MNDQAWGKYLNRFEKIPLCLLLRHFSDHHLSGIVSGGNHPFRDRPLYTSPNRFTRMSQSAYWNPGNGSPDSVCFSVDKPGIVIAGVGVYGGGPHYDYELEILDEVTQVSWCCLHWRSGDEKSYRL